MNLLIIIFLQPSNLYEVPAAPAPVPDPPVVEIETAAESQIQERVVPAAHEEEDHHHHHHCEGGHCK